jgi:hypothetical protein
VQLVGELHSRLDAVGLRLAVVHVRLDAAYRVAQAACALPAEREVLHCYLLAAIVVLAVRAVQLALGLG